MFSIEKVKTSGKYNDATYIIKNVNKYVGKYTSVKCRSSYEIKMCEILDLEPTVVRWSSECNQLQIYYKSQIDGCKKQRHYFPDFYAVITKNGKTVKYVFEVKPAKFLICPTKPKPPLTIKTKNRYVAEMRRYILIMDKRKAAIEWCQERGYVYQFITEAFLFG